MLGFLNKKNMRLPAIAAGLLFLINGITASLYSGTDLGVLITYLLAAVLFLCGFSGGIFSSRLLKIAKVSLLVLLLLLLAGGTLLYLIGGKDTATFKEDAVIVLGTTVIGDSPTKALQNRLDAAISYNRENPQALIIVTGGQGTEENSTEASVMAAYLKNHGISGDLIIEEDRATSTVENFSYATQLLPENAKVCYISNDFHIYRAGVLAEKAGLLNATHFHGNTPWYMVVPNAFRESVVVLKMWFID